MPTATALVRSSLERMKDCLSILTLKKASGWPPDRSSRWILNNTSRVENVGLYVSNDVQMLVENNRFFHNNSNNGIECWMLGFSLDLFILLRY